MIYERLYGFEHLKTANALGNVGSVSRRMNDTVACHRAMYRALNIFINIYRNAIEESDRDLAAKTVMRHRAQMYQFEMSDWEETSGITYEEYVNFNEEEYIQKQAEIKLAQQWNEKKRSDPSNDDTDDKYGDDGYAEL